MKNYYEVLGVAQNSTSDEITKAYRKLAKELHPDKNKEEDAQHRFAAVAEAYEHLSDDGKRKTHDRQLSGGHDFIGGFADFFGLRPNNRAQKGPDVVIAAFIDLKDILHEHELTVKIPTDENCSKCNGSGASEGKSKKTCDNCGGKGTINKVSVQGNVQILRSGLCDKCNGSGKIIDNADRCKYCNDGRINVEKEMTVKTMPGHQPEYLMRIGPVGKAGKNGGQRGDAILRVNIKSHEKFKRLADNPNDLMLEMPISFVQACLGDRISAEMIDGSMHEVDISPHTPNGRTILIEGHGVPSMVNSKRGNLWVRFSIEVPSSITDQQRDLLRQFEEIENAKEKHHK